MYWLLAIVTFLVFIIKGMSGFANSLFFGAVSGVYLVITNII